MSNINSDTKFDINPVKSANNKRDHGFDFEEALKLFSDPNRTEDPDDSNGHSDYEDRYKSIGFAGERLIYLSYTIRKNRVRIITARKANKTEKEYYDRCFRNLRI